jgi:hypothetical protein
LTIILFQKLKKEKPQQNEKWYMLIFLLFTFMITLLPVINLEITSLGQVQSDRYGYLPSIPAVLIIAVIIDLLSGHTLLKNTIYIIVLVTFTFFTVKTNKLWQESSRRSEQILNSVIENVQESTREIYFLNVPETCNGIYLFRNGLKEAIMHKSSFGKPIGVHILTYQVDNSGQTNFLRETNANAYSLTLQEGERFFNTDTAAFSDQNFIKIRGTDNTLITFTTSSTDSVHPNKLFLYYNGEVMLPVK